MFDSIKVLCGCAAGFGDTGVPVVVAEEKYLKIINSLWQCPQCGRLHKELAQYFETVQALLVALRNFERTNFKIRTYTLVQHIHSDDENFEPAKYLLENHDWVRTNMQIACIEICVAEESGYRIEIWGERFVFAQIEYPDLSGCVTFERVLQRGELHVHGHEVNFQSLKAVWDLVCEYNDQLLSLAGAGLNAAPVDIKEPLLNHLNRTESLLELLPDEEIYK